MKINYKIWVIKKEMYDKFDENHFSDTVFDGLLEYSLKCFSHRSFKTLNYNTSHNRKHFALFWCGFIYVFMYVCIYLFI